MPPKKKKPDCRFRDPIISMCNCTNGWAERGTQCQFAAEPNKCLGYEALADGVVYTQTPAQPVQPKAGSLMDIFMPKNAPPTPMQPVKTEPVLDTEDLTDYVARMENELQSMGIKVVREPPYPHGRVCMTCHTERWWWRPPTPQGGPGEWVCACCHPEPGSPAPVMIGEAQTNKWKSLPPAVVVPVNASPEPDKAPDWF